MDHHWSGNIRELKNVIDRALVFSPGSIINPEAIRKAFKGKLNEKKRTLREATDEFEKDFIKNNLVINDWNVTQTADKIAIERSNLYKKIKHHKIKIRKD
jgi:two-component system, NtrC family, nitrogen regulation response regulator NtrX